MRVSRVIYIYIYISDKDRKCDTQLFESWEGVVIHKPLFSRSTIHESEPHVKEVQLGEEISEFNLE